MALGTLKNRHNCPRMIYRPAPFPDAARPRSPTPAVPESAALMPALTAARHIIEWQADLRRGCRPGFPLQLRQPLALYQTPACLVSPGRKLSGT